MRRYLTLAILTVTAAGLLLVAHTSRTASGNAGQRSAADTVYVPSDVALLATTGRPQLAEFYHPD